MPLRHHRQGALITTGLALLLAACAGQRPGTTVPPPSPEFSGHLPLGARPWIETDALATINSQALGEHFRSALTAIEPIDGLAVINAEVNFGESSIDLALDAQPADPGQAQHSIRFAGGIDLTYSGSGLSWIPFVHGVVPAEGTFDGDPVPIDDGLIQRFNAGLARQIVLSRNNHLGLGILPPAAISIAGEFADPRGTAASRRFALPGALTVAASRMAPGPHATSIALDLEFVEGISHCAADFSISRSAFAREVDNREPRGIEPRIDTMAGEWHYFTEVSEAPRNLTLVHYWFADGRAAGITELPVEPSARWRTWSSLPVSPGFAEHVEVFVADRDSGCIVDSAHIEASAGGQAIARRDSFDDLSRSFQSAGGQPRTATVEISRSALAEALNRAASGRRFAVRVDMAEPRALSLSGFLDSLAGAEFNCEQRDCSVVTECRVDFSRCQRRQDTRECTTCLFRNPLNDRCVSQRTDADCEAQKASLNARYSASFDACMAREESARASCELRGQEALRACEQQALEYRSACTANRQALTRLDHPVAGISGEAHAAGSVTLVYSGLQADGGFQRLKTELQIEADLTVSGTLSFSAQGVLGDLGSCIDGWDGGFEVRADRASTARRLAGSVFPEDEELGASWPGMTVALGLSRGPLEEVLSNQPGRFAECATGLTPAQVSARASGENQLLLRGLLPVDIQPGPIRVELPAVEGRFGGRDFEAAARIEAQHIRYELQE